MEKIQIVAVSFHCAGKLFDFDVANFELKDRDQVVVETERGRALGMVIGSIREEASSSSPSQLKPILRKASPQDIAQAQKNKERETDALKFCRNRITERKMPMKMVQAEYLFDGSKIIFYFTADGRVDFRDLVRDLAQHFRTRIEMRQIGVRDEAKIVGGLGCCGRELCCCSYLRSFAPVSVKMAKAQGLALNPSKISGQCGRLLCCLSYEYETYNEMRKTLPKCGKKLSLPDGTAEVIGLNVLAQTLTIADKNGRREVHVDDLDKPAPVTDNPPGRRSATPGGETRKTTDKKDEARKTPRRQRPRSEQPPAAVKEAQPQAPEGKKRPNNNTPKPPLPGKPAEQKIEEQPQRKRSRSRRRSRRKPERNNGEKPEQNKT